jgi:AcrR family transcriptional regulator
MARTQAPDYEQRRAAIVETAAGLYARKGFAGSSVADLAAALGASKSLIYHYYPSKEEILFEVMDSHLRRLAEALDAVMAMDIEPAEKLREIALAFMRLYVGAAARHKVLLNELGSLPAARRSEIVRRQRRLIAAVQDLLVKIQPELRARPRLGRPAAMLFFGMINWTHTWFREDGPASAGEVADLAADLALRGLAGLGSEKPPLP